MSIRGAAAPRRAGRRGSRAAALAGAAWLLTAAPAGADPAGPSDFSSSVTAVEPATDGLDATIRGGDSFLEIGVEPGHVVEVAGYSGEPYLRVDEDGTVQRNRLSAATYLNDDRKGAVEIPAEVTRAMADDAEPDWEEVATSGTYAWHDHRVHWMAEVSPPVGRGERVPGEYDPWVVPVTVDGTPVEIQGELIYESAVSPLPWAALAVTAAAALAAVGRRLSRSSPEASGSEARGLRLGAVVVTGVAAAAVVVGRADWSSTPDGSGNPLLWALPIIAVVTAAGAVALARRSSGVVLALAAVAALSGWALFRIQALLKPVLPTELPFALDRATIALALGTSLALAYVAVTGGTFALPALADDDPD